MKLKVVLDEKDEPRIVEVPVDADGQEIVVEKLEEIPSKIVNKDGEVAVATEEDKKVLPVFTDEEYLIASPVVLGFAFAEKLWLEFTVSGVKDIVWNEGAYDSLVLEDNTKAIVKALVESHKYHPAESIDDVIQGKGKGLVAVLHGPPGTGKTLTAEGISELLKCPLYMVSAGELGTDPRTLEAELQKILDIAHAWGAVLLLDEADVFLEKRTIQDIHRNALVSIFLRLLEYFQGILFLTTNRVETFDDAFQSRIHIALRYGELSIKAKKSVFKMFIERVRVLEGIDTMPFKEEDYNALARHNLNGRQVRSLTPHQRWQILTNLNRSKIQSALLKPSPSITRNRSAWNTSSAFSTSLMPSTETSRVVQASRMLCVVTSDHSTSCVSSSFRFSSVHSFGSQWHAYDVELTVRILREKLAFHS
jgi:DNA polymerase III delta prime subunit